MSQWFAIKKVLGHWVNPIQTVVTITRHKALHFTIAGLFISTIIVQALQVAKVHAAPLAIINPDLEQVIGSKPKCFDQVGWGNNAVTWSLVSDTHSGSKAQSVKISKYVSGDRKLMMTENSSCAPAVTPGETYELSAWYKSTSTKNSLTAFRHSDRKSVV